MSIPSIVTAIANQMADEYSHDERSFDSSIGAELRARALTLAQEAAAADPENAATAYAAVSEMDAHLRDEGWRVAATDVFNARVTPEGLTEWLPVDIYGPGAKGGYSFGSRRVHAHVATRDEHMRYGLALQAMGRADIDLGKKHVRHAKKMPSAAPAPAPAAATP